MVFDFNFPKIGIIVNEFAGVHHRDGYESATGPEFYNAVGYSEPGGPAVLKSRRRQRQSPDAGMVRVRVFTSGVNPTDWKAREGGLLTEIPAGRFQVPHHDGAGVVDAVGTGVDPDLIGSRVWLWLAAFNHLDGSAQEYTVVPANRISPLPDAASFELGAALGVPFLTAHRALTLHRDAPDQLSRGALSGQYVLVPGGAGAVGNAAIQLATWAGATVIATASSEDKLALARRAGAVAALNYRTEDIASEVRRIARDGVATIVEVAPAANVLVDSQVIAPHGVIASYAKEGGDEAVIQILPNMRLCASWHFLLLYALRESELQAAAAAIGSALGDGAIRVGVDAGLPLHFYPLDRVGDAQKAVEAHALGKVIVRISEQ